jgi:hypothetical protein
MERAKSRDDEGVDKPRRSQRVAIQDQCFQAQKRDTGRGLVMVVAEMQLAVKEV